MDRNNVVYVLTNVYFNLCGCRYYDLDAYFKRQMEKEMKRGFKKVQETERTVFNDEEQRRYVLVQVILLSFL